MLGEQTSAREYFERFAALWVDADTLGAGLLDQARQGLARTAGNR